MKNHIDIFISNFLNIETEQTTQLKQNKTTNNKQTHQGSKAFDSQVLPPKKILPHQIPSVNPTRWYLINFRPSKDQAMASRCAALVTWSRLLQIFQGPPVLGQDVSTTHRVEATTHRSIHMEEVALCLVFFIPAKQSAAFQKKQLG